MPLFPPVITATFPDELIHEIANNRTRNSRHSFFMLGLLLSCSESRTISSSYYPHIVLVLVLERVCDVESILWTGLKSVFVPKGPSDGSLAVYCQECVLKKNRPVGNGMSRSTGAFTAQGRRNVLSDPNHTVP
jgi:hypothetical protein